MQTKFSFLVFFITKVGKTGYKLHYAKLLVFFITKLGKTAYKLHYAKAVRN